MRLIGIILLAWAVILYSCGGESKKTVKKETPPVDLSEFAKPIVHNSPPLVQSPCLFDTVMGYARIESVKPLYKNPAATGGIDAYEVLFSFTPWRVFRHPYISFNNRLFTLLLTDGKRPYLPGPKFIERYRIKAGTNGYKTKMLVIKRGVCQPLIPLSEDWDYRFLADYGIEDPAMIASLEDEKVNEDGSEQQMYFVRTPDCQFDSIPGTLTITNVRTAAYAASSKLHYDEKEITYTFRPSVALPNHNDYTALFNSEQSFKLMYYNGMEISAGPLYCSKYGVRYGQNVKGHLLVSRSSAKCPNVSFTAPNLPNLDVSEAESQQIMYAARTDDKPCNYSESNGYIQIVSIKDDTEFTEGLGYKPLVVQFVYTPLDLVDFFKVRPMTIYRFLLWQDGTAIPPGPEYIKKYNIQLRGVYEANLKYIDSGTCQPYIFTIQGFPNDLFELE